MEDDEIPHYGSLLQMIRKEEARRHRRKTLTVAKNKAVVDPDGATEKLHAEIESLKQEVVKLRQKTDQAEQQLKNEQDRDSPDVRQQLSHTHGNSSEHSRKPPRRRLKFCFQCGDQSHTLWNCDRPANADLVKLKFDQVRQASGNGQGSS